MSHHFLETRHNGLVESVAMMAHCLYHQCTSSIIQHSYSMVELFLFIEHLYSWSTQAQKSLFGLKMQLESRHLILAVVTSIK